LLNVQELRAAGQTEVQRAKVLRDYLDLVMMRPELVEARFRSSALAGLLVEAVAAKPGCATDVSGVLGVRERGLERRLRRINRLGLRQARALLQAWFVPLLWHRPRVYGEPQGNERRQLRKSLHVSSCCAFARRYKRAGFKPMWWPALWWSELVVRWLAGRSAA
jgi:hypothetical protein